MQLCDYWESSKYGAVQCRSRLSECQGSFEEGRCYPSYIWSRTPAGVTDGTHYYGYLAEGGFCRGEYDGFSSYAFSVRCVLGFETGSSSGTMNCTRSCVPGLRRKYFVSAAFDSKEYLAQLSYF